MCPGTGKREIRKNPKKKTAYGYIQTPPPFRTAGFAHKEEMRKNQVNWPRHFFAGALAPTAPEPIVYVRGFPRSFSDLRLTGGVPLNDCRSS